MIGNYGTMVSNRRIHVGSFDGKTDQNAGSQHQRFRKICEQNTECLRTDRDRSPFVSLLMVCEKSTSNSAITQIRSHGICWRHHRRSRVRSVRRGNLGPSDDPSPLDGKQWCQSWCCVLRTVFHIGAAWVKYLRQLYLGSERPERYVSGST
jgi:hypothetical protein